MHQKTIKLFFLFFCFSVFSENQKPFVPKVIQSPRDTLAKKEHKKRALAYQTTNPFSIGIKAPFDYLLGSTSTGSSWGIDYGGGLELRIPLGPEFRISVHPLFYHISISRKIDGSGSITDTGATFTQYINYIAGELLFSYRFSEELTSEKEFLTDEWWVEVGGMFGYPIIAIQADSTGDSFSYTASDRLLYVSLGVNTKMNLTNTLSLWPTLRGFYRLLATSSTSTFGGGIEVALHWQL